jgi:hypothetical protein
MVDLQFALGGRHFRPARLTPDTVLYTGTTTTTPLGMAEGERTAPGFTQDRVLRIDCLSADLVVIRSRTSWDWGALPDEHTGHFSGSELSSGSRRALGPPDARRWRRLLASRRGIPRPRKLYPTR